MFFDGPTSSVLLSVLPTRETDGSWSIQTLGSSKYYGQFKKDYVFYLLP
jgi:hypothetical protein